MPKDALLALVHRQPGAARVRAVVARAAISLGVDAWLNR
jgi:hypothetical protein